MKSFRLKKGSKMDEISKVSVIFGENLSLNFCRKEPGKI